MKALLCALALFALALPARAEAPTPPRPFDCKPLAEIRPQIEAAGFDLVTVTGDAYIQRAVAFHNMIPPQTNDVFTSVVVALSRNKDARVVAVVGYGYDARICASDVYDAEGWAAFQKAVWGERT